MCVLELNAEPTTAPTESLAEVAYRAIEEMIVTRRLRPGSMISENQLSEQLGCGRTPIREALQRLKFEGFVEIHPRRGVLVAPIDVVKQLELLEVRRPLECLVVRLAAVRALDRERAEMRRWPRRSGPPPRRPTPSATCTPRTRSTRPYHAPRTTPCSPAASA